MSSTTHLGQRPLPVAPPRLLRVSQSSIVALSLISLFAHSTPGRFKFPARKQSRHFFFIFSTLTILSKGYSRNKPRKRYGFSVS
jgi:hypothetical protein